MDSEFSLRDVAVLDFPRTRVAVCAHRGDKSELNKTIQRFIAWRRQAGLSPGDSATFNVFSNAFGSSEIGAFDVDLCAATDQPIAPNDAGIAAGEIPAGRCAKLRLTGPDDRLGAAAHFLYAEWLPQSGAAAGDFPLFAQRVAFFPEVPESEAIVDLYLPLR